MVNGESLQNIVRGYARRLPSGGLANVTVGDLLSLDMLRDAQVLAGGPWLQQRRIEWVSVIEIPVEDFIRRDEFVLTTGLGCGDDPELFLKFVEEIAQAGAAGLAISVGRHVTSVPDAVVALAEQKHFPLIQIPWNVRFADINRRVVSELAINHSGDGEASLLRQMLHRIAQRDPTDLIVSTIEQLWEVPCAFFDSQRATWYGSSRTTEWCMEHHQSLKPMIATPRRTGHALLESLMSIESIDGHPVGLLPIQSVVRWFGTLLLIPDSRQTGMDMKRLPFLEPVIQILSVAILNEDAMEATETLVREDFVWKLAKGDFKNWEELLAEAGTTRCDISQYYLTVVGKIGNLDSLYRYSQTVFRQQSSEDWEEYVARTVQKALATAARAANYAVLTTYQRSEWIAYFVSAKRLEIDRIHQIVDAAEAALALHAEHAVISWGIAQSVPGVQGFHYSYQNARRALEMGIRREGVGHRATYDRVQSRKILHQLSQDDGVQRVVQETLGTLLEYDLQHGTDLVHTLTSYLFNRTNVSLTARTLHLHRQSLLYRLNKIETLTGRALDNPDDLFLLELSARLLGSMDTNLGYHAKGSAED